jgi:hypothetical protein
MEWEWTRNESGMTQGDLVEFLNFSIPGSFLVHSWDSWDSSGIHQELVGESKDLKIEGAYFAFFDFVLLWLRMIK